jgi:DNA polymerase III subunit delta
MPSAYPASQTSDRLILICGDDEYTVKQKAKQRFEIWQAKLSDLDHEIIDSTASSSAETIQIINRLHVALQTLPLFGNGKLIWLKNCNFLGDDKTASSQAALAAMQDLTQTLKSFDWSNTILLISAGKVDKRKAFFKLINRMGAVSVYNALSMDDRDWPSQAQKMATGFLKDLQIDISPDALQRLILYVGNDIRLLQSECEKLSLHVNDSSRISITDVEKITTKTKHARAFALGDALGERNLPKLLRTLNDELWEMKFDNSRSSIGLLYGLTVKIRTLIFVKEMLRERLIQARVSFPQFKAQLARISKTRFSEYQRINPLSINPYVLYKALLQAQNYSMAELTTAMSLLLDCNYLLISSNLDESLLLQQTLSEIAGHSDMSN